MPALTATLHLGCDRDHQGKLPAKQFPPVEGHVDSSRGGPPVASRVRVRGRGRGRGRGRNRGRLRVPAFITIPSSLLS